MTRFRAALDRAYLDGLLTTDFAWRSKLRPIKNADQRRELYLDRAQRLKFFQKAPDDLAAFLRGLCQLPLRPRALAGLQAGDFDRRLKVLKIGQDKSGKDWRIKLLDVTARFCEAVAKEARCTEQGHHLTALHGEVDTAQRCVGADVSGQLLDLDRDRVHARVLMSYPILQADRDALVSAG